MEFVRSEFPGVKIILNNANLGFAGGYNKALKEVHADCYVLLNSDVEVTANWIQPVIEVMEKNKQVAACQPKIKSCGRRRGIHRQIRLPVLQGKNFLHT
jgi:GT2 family glycosyltransferase